MRRVRTARWSGSVVRRAVEDPGLNLVDRRLAEVGTTEGHPRARDGRGALELLDQVTVGRIVGLHPHQGRLLEARHIDQHREAAAGGQVLRPR